jgi:hypothetical protein
MKIKTVSVHYGLKVNLGDFNSANVECTLWADIDESEGENLDSLMKSLWGMAKENVKAQLSPIQKETKGGGANANVSETFLGLPVVKQGKS